MNGWKPAAMIWTAHSMVDGRPFPGANGLFIAVVKGT